MNKIYIPVGVALSIVLHMTFFRVPGARLFNNEEVLIKEPEACPVTAIIPEKEIVKPVYKEKKEALVYEKKKVLEEVFKPASVAPEMVEEKKGNIKIEEPSKEYMPALKMDISDYETLIGAARFFNMRVALMDNIGNFVDEISTAKIPRIMSIKESLSEYSNRIRMLPLGYFGEKIEKVLILRDIRPCVLVPAEVDKEFAEIQNRAISERGYIPEDVDAVAGRFVEHGGVYRLIIERIYLKNGKEEII